MGHLHYGEEFAVVRVASSTFITFRSKAADMVRKK